MHSPKDIHPDTGLPWHVIVIPIAVALMLLVQATGARTAGGAEHCDLDVPGNHLTIQAAINAAQPGNTICVAAGTYTENLTVNVANLTLEGPNADIAASETRNPEAVIVGTITVGTNADGITIDGFKIQGSMLVRGLGQTVTNNILEGAGQNGITTASAAPVRNNSFVITGNSLTGFNQALRLDGDNQTQALLVSDNQITANTRAIQTFVSLHAGLAGEVVDNVITENTDGIRLAGGGFNVNGNVISNNTTYGLDVGIDGADPIGATDATCNWWGAADGPSGVGPGSGDEIIERDNATGSVTFTPWSETDDAEEPCSGGVGQPTDPDDKEMCMNGGWAEFGFRSQGLCIQFVNTGRDSRS